MIISSSTSRSLERGSESVSPCPPALTRSRTRTKSPMRNKSPLRRVNTSPIRNVLPTFSGLPSITGITGNIIPKPTRVLKTVSADQDKSYYNLLGTDDLVSTEHVLKAIKMIQTTESIIKLELEDIVCRKQNQKEILKAIRLLVSSSRLWKSIKFVDTLHVSGGDQSPSTAMSQLIDYETKKDELLDFIINNCTQDIVTRRCLVFEVNIEVDAGSNIESVLKLMQLLQDGKSNLETVEFGGGLFGCSEAEVPKKLESLFQKEVKASSSDLKDEQDDSLSFLTSEMVTMKLFYTAPYLEGNKVPEVIPKCIKKMTNLKGWAKVEKSLPPTIMRSRTRSGVPQRSRSTSPKPSGRSARSKRCGSSPKPERRNRKADSCLDQYQRQNTCPQTKPAGSGNERKNGKTDSCLHQHPYQRQKTCPQTKPSTPSAA